MFRKWLCFCSGKLYTQNWNMAIFYPVDLSFATEKTTHGFLADCTITALLSRNTLSMFDYD
jgi:hypothetical protein